MTADLDDLLDEVMAVVNRTAAHSRSYRRKRLRWCLEAALERAGDGSRGSGADMPTGQDGCKAPSSPAPAPSLAAVSVEAPDGRREQEDGPCDRAPVLTAMAPASARAAGAGLPARSDKGHERQGLIKQLRDLSAASPLGKRRGEAVTDRPFPPPDEMERRARARGL